MEKELDNIVKYITNSDEYKRVILLKDKMKSNELVSNLVNEIKLLQMDYVNSEFDLEIKNRLDGLNNELNLIPIYIEYNNSLDVVNEMIELVKSSLNSYFDNVFNDKV